MCVVCLQDSWTPVYSVVTNAQKLKWLRQRLTGSTADTALMSRITEFILHEHPIDIEKLRKSLHYQVSPPFAMIIFSKGKI